jgi:tRNA A37 N6-isopentenylltransferase MiaA
MTNLAINKSVVVYGPQGCGKTTHAAALAKHFGLDTICDEADHIRPNRFMRTGTLYLMIDRPAGADDFARRVLSFDDAMRQAGIAR